MDVTAPTRYHRQTLLPQIGETGQQKLRAARILLVGCGALGTVAAEQLTRAGIGHLRIIDRDLVEITNLQRQTLFDESDAQNALPKAIAAQNRLRAINSSITIEGIVADLHAGNIDELLKLESGPIDLILDGTDNVETRYLLNDAAVKRNMPWVYGACVGAEGRVMGILPSRTACLRCLFPTPPQRGDLATCDTAGVLAPAASVVASLQVTTALQILLGSYKSAGTMFSLDLWNWMWRSSDVAKAPIEGCFCCQQRRFEFLDIGRASSTVSLCGRHSVQIRPPGRQTVDLKHLAIRLSAAGTVETHPYFLRCHPADQQGVCLTVFPDARVIVSGTDDLARARSLCARYLGS